MLASEWSEMSNNVYTVSHDVNQELSLFSLECCRVDSSTSIFHIYMCVFCANDTINAKAAN